VSEKRARQYRHFDLAAVRAELLSAIGDTTGEERQRRIGRTLKRWEVAPPRPEPAADSRAYIAQLNATYGDLFRAGSDTSDLDVPALEQQEAGHG
jgi:hypothetical protein